MIANGAIVVYNGTWTQTKSIFVDSVVQDILSGLSTAGLVSRNAPKLSGTFLGLNASTFGVSLQLQVENGIGFSSVDDIISVIRHAVYEETGEFPISDSIPQVQDTANSPPTQTGQPGTPLPGGTPQCIAGGSSDTTGSFSISCWWQNLTTKGLSTVGILALLIVAGFGIFIYYGPQRVRITQ